MTENRPSARARGYDGRWDKARKSYLASHPHCVMCAQQGQQGKAEHVDHIKAHKGDQALFWSMANWQGLCGAHHNSTKQAEERRGYSSQVDDQGWPTDTRHPANRGR